jgi:DnaJ-class molecular chaperone
LRLRGKGVLRGDGMPRGDQYVTLNVVLPKEPDNQLQEFLQNWEPSEPYDVRATEGMTG